MLNIQFQISGMILIILSAIFFFRLPKLKLRTTKIFETMLPIAAAAALLDIASVFAIYYADDLPVSFVKFACKIYLVVLMSLIIVDFAYLCADAFPDLKKFRKITSTVALIFGAAMTAASFLPIEYVCENNGQVIYSKGAFTLACYGIYAAMFAGMFAILIVRRSTIHKRRKPIVWIWLISLLLAVVIQFFNSSLLLVTFAMCLDMLILFLMIENPEFYIDKESGFFHINALARYVNEVYSDKNCYIISTRYSDYDLDFFKKTNSAVIFVGSGEIYLIFDKPEPFENALGQISKHMNKRSVYICENSSIIGGAREIQKIFKKMQELKRVGKAARFRKKYDNVYIIDNEVKILFAERAAAKKMVAQAISGNADYKIEPFYQPIYSIETGKFTSAEALARIRGKDGQIIPPVKFIPVAEENGSIIELGKIMFERVCEFLGEIDDVGLKYIEINLSVVQGEDKNLADDICAIMEKHCIPFNKINLEITETASIQGREQLLENMKKMMAKGLNFSLDDFGTGQSNLDYMTVMPVNLVKFDRTITQSYFVLDKTRSVMRAAVAMIHDMGMKIVIEGIETEEQLEEMRRLKVDYIQGYYFSKPLPRDEFAAFLKEHNQ